MPLTIAVSTFFQRLTQIVDLTFWCTVKFYLRASQLIAIVKKDVLAQTVLLQALLHIIDVVNFLFDPKFMFFSNIGIKHERQQHLESIYI